MAVADPFPKYSGADWLARHLKRELTPFERLVAGIVGQAERGIYHLTHRELALSRWEGDRVHVVYTRGGSLSTYDGITLTDYVGLCHLFAVRLDITARLVVSETDTDDFESTRDLPELAGHVCPPGWDDGPQLETFHRDEPNEDFDPAEPEHPEDNPRTVRRELARSVSPCLELTFHPREHGADCFSRRHLTLDQMAAYIRRLGHPVTRVPA